MCVHLDRKSHVTALLSAGLLKFTFLWGVLICWEAGSVSKPLFFLAFRANARVRCAANGRRRLAILSKSRLTTCSPPCHCCVSSRRPCHFSEVLLSEATAGARLLYRGIEEVQIENELCNSSSEAEGPDSILKGNAAAVACSFAGRPVVPSLLLVTPRCALENLIPHPSAWNLRSSRLLVLWLQQL